MSKSHLGAPPRLTQALFPLLIATLLCPLSVMLTIEMCVHLRGDNLGSYFMAFGWELTKIYSGAVAWYRLRRSFSVRNLAWAAVATATLTGSLAAALGAFAHRYDAQRTQALEQSDTFRNTRIQLEQMDNQIALLSQTAVADVHANYRTRTVQKTYPAIQALNEKREHLAASLARYRAQPATVLGNDYFADLGRLVGHSATRMEMIAALFFAAVLEVTLILVCEYLASFWNASRASASASPGASPRASRFRASRLRDGIRVHPGASEKTQKCITGLMHRMHTASQADAPDAEMHPAQDTRYQVARERIRAGELEPSYRGLQRAFNLGQRTARRFLDALVAEGVVDRSARKHTVAGQGVAL